MRVIAANRNSVTMLVCAVAFTWLAVEAGDRTAEFQVELSDPVAPTLPPRVYRVVQSSDENGFPAGYALTFTTHVCVDEQCRMVKVTMHWDALGYYERLEYPADTPLTKKKHVPFAAEDYVKLDQILKDRDSILGSQPLEIFGAPVQQAEVPGIDGWSGATPQAVKDAVVDGAAYTSWTMWRWANGEIVPKLQGLTEQRCTPGYLRHLLQSKDRRAVDFALKYITRHRASDEQFVDDVFHVLETGDREHVSLSIQFLHGALKDRRRLHDRLIDSYCRLNSNYSPLILDYLSSQDDLPRETLEGLTGILNELPYFQIHLILRLLDKRAFFSEQVESDVAGLLDNQDFFIARRASEHLMKQQLGSETKRKLDAFRQQYRQRL
jgi:hypothetical protein